MHVPQWLLAVLVAAGMGASLTSGHVALPNHPAFVQSGFSGIAGVTLAVGGPAPGPVILRPDVTVTAWDGPLRLVAQTDADALGLFWLPLPPGVYTITARGAGDVFGRQLSVRARTMTFATVVQQMR